MASSLASGNAPVKILSELRSVREMIIGSFEEHQIGDEVSVRTFPYLVTAKSSYDEWISAGGLEENPVRAGESEAYFYRVEPKYRVTITDV